MKRKKKVLSLLLAMAVILAFAPMAYAAEAEEITPTYDWYNGVTDGNYEIKTASDFIGFSNIVNGLDGQKKNLFSKDDKITLAGEIDLKGISFVPIGTHDEPFKGTFDGNGKIIKNAKILVGSDADRIWAGIFGCVTGTVKNFTLDSIDVDNTSALSNSADSEQAASGAAVGIVRQGGIVEDITVNATCSVNGVYRTGGIVGSSRDQNTSVKDCVNHASVTGTGNYTGGIIGAAHNVLNQRYKTGTIVTSCRNEGTVSGTSEVGGIVGYGDRVSISGCTNKGTITGTGNYGTGGILGCDIYNPRKILYTPPNGSKISNCTNEGSVTAPRAGGILGSYVVSPGQKQHGSVEKYSTITSCTNKGEVKSLNRKGKCGAIYGAPISYMSGDAEQYVNHLIVKIENCTVGGKVEEKEVPTEDAEFKTFISPSNMVNLNGNHREVESL